MAEKHLDLVPPGPSRRSLGSWLSIACLALAACSVPLTQDPSPRTPQGEEALSVASSVEPAAAPQAVPLRAPAGEYRIGPRDLLEISVLDQADWLRQVPVRPDGRISYPLVGDLEAAGRTVEELRTDIERRLQRYLKRPQVSVSVREFLSQVPHVYVAGEVRTPGAYELRPPHDSFLDAVFAAGGVTADADLSLSYVIRGKDVIASDFDRILRQGTRGGSNFVMADRDLIYFPTKDFRFIYVLGEVERPSAVPAPHPMKLIEALALAEGLAPGAYKPEIKVIRGGLRSGSALSIDFEAVAQGDLKNNVTLYPGDIVYAPRGPLRAWNDLLQEVTPSLNTLLLVEVLQDTNNN